MPSESVNYQCPNCGGPLCYDIASGKLACDHCGARFEVSDIERVYAEDRQTAEERAREEPSYSTYVCSSCGARLEAGPSTSVTTCPYCGNRVVLTSRLSGEFAPDYVIPFKVDRESADAALRKKCRFKPLVPRDFRRGGRVEALQGLYVPFWLYDAHATAQADYECTTGTSQQDGDTIISRTKHYDVHREGEMDFRGVPSNASDRLRKVSALEPYDYREIVPFASAYLVGFVASRWDRDSKECRPEARSRMTQTVREELEETLDDYDAHELKGLHATYRWDRTSYALLPVWVVGTSWRGRHYTLMMNGQTGRLVGTLPISRTRLLVSALMLLGLAFALHVHYSGAPAPDPAYWQRFAMYAVLIVAFGCLLLLLPSILDTDAADGSDASDYAGKTGMRITNRADKYTRTETEVTIIPSVDDDE